MLLSNDSCVARSLLLASLCCISLKTVHFYCFTHAVTQELNILVWNVCCLRIDFLGSTCHGMEERNKSRQWCKVYRADLLDEEVKRAFVISDCWHFQVDSLKLREKDKLQPQQLSKWPQNKWKMTTKSNKTTKNGHKKMHKWKLLEKTKNYIDTQNSWLRKWPQRQKNNHRKVSFSLFIFIQLRSISDSSQWLIYTYIRITTFPVERICTKRRRFVFIHSINVYIFHDMNNALQQLFQSIHLFSLKQPRCSCKLDRRVWHQTKYLRCWKKHRILKHISLIKETCSEMKL